MLSDAIVTANREQTRRLEELVEQVAETRGKSPRRVLTEESDSGPAEEREPATAGASDDE
jgi:hypothetical protein